MVSKATGKRDREWRSDQNQPFQRKQNKESCLIRWYILCFMSLADWMYEYKLSAPASASTWQNKYSEWKPVEPAKTSDKRVPEAQGQIRSANTSRRETAEMHSCDSRKTEPSWDGQILPTTRFDWLKRGMGARGFWWSGLIGEGRSGVRSSRWLVEHGQDTFHLPTGHPVCLCGRDNWVGTKEVGHTHTNVHTNAKLK